LQEKLAAAIDWVADAKVPLRGERERPRTSLLRWGGTMLGDFSIEGAYFYPLPAGAEG
jgi:hypothetical protein